MKLHLLRHAKTVQSVASGRDIDRILLEKGQKQAALLASFFSGKSNLEIHCSSSVRTRQTLEFIHESLLDSHIHFSEELYLCSAIEMLNYVNKLPTSKDILIIGHNEGISDFATYLCEEFIHFKTAEYCCLETNCSSWSELSKGTAILKERFRPEVD